MASTMQMNVDSATSLSWIKHDAKPLGDKPENFPGAKSGHSMTVIGTNCYIFGGLNGADINDPDDVDGDVEASNNIFRLKLGSGGMEWIKVNPRGGGPAPLPRWHHSATLYEGTQLIIFGGFHTHEQRLNDVWIFDAVSMGWKQPNAQHNSEAVVPNQLIMASWANVPSPRAAHSATLVGENVYVFGGYGGLGYSRRDLDDLYALNLESWTWTKLTAKGTAPEKRSGHQACTIETKVFVFGGMSATSRFNDMYVLDVEIDPPVWSKVNNSLSMSTWNHTACSVIAIPTWKIFTFGGNTSSNSEADGKLGSLDNSIAIYDAATGRWSSPMIEGKPPCPRCDTCVAYDAKGARLFIFGGWSEYWHGDLYSLDVGDIVGPPYAITDISPKMGPITGGTDVTIAGIDFVNTTDVVVRFGSKKSCMDVQGIFVNQSKITCVSPDFTKFPPGEVDVRVALDGDSFTTTFQKYCYFSVTNCATCIMYGPGLLSGCAVNEDVSFMIQARDDANNNRTTGGDEYTVVISMLGAGEDGENLRVMGVAVDDLDDGRYQVSYTAKYPGKYLIEVDFLGTFGGKAGPVRGSGTIIEFDANAPRDNNLMAGDLVIKALKADVAYLEKFINDLSTNIFVRVKDDSWSPEEQIRVLMNVKEALLRLESKSAETILIFDRCEAVAKFLNDEGVSLGNLGGMLSAAKGSWDRLIRETPTIQTKISPMMRSHASKIRLDIQGYEAHVAAYKTEMSSAEFKIFATGPYRAKDILDAADEIQAKERSVCDKMAHVANVFECQKDMAKAIELIADVDTMLKDFRLLWDYCTKVMGAIEDSKKIKFSNLNPEEFEDSAKQLSTSVRRLPKAVKPSDAFKGLDKMVKEFVVTCPIISSLKAPSMRERHWNELMDVVKKKFVMPSKNANLEVKVLMELGLHKHTADVEEITEKANKEAKHEETLKNLEVVWSTASFIMNFYKDTDVPLLKLEEEITDQLESDQMAIQSIVGGRYAHFKKEATLWQKALGAVSDITQLLSEIQRTWSYLEPLFIGSEEVKKELPEDAKRFKEIDDQVRVILQKAWKTRKIKTVCNASGLQEKLLNLEKKLEQCKKSLSEYLDGKRRQFPRFYFMSEADLLLLLSNSSQPVIVLQQIDKILLSTRELVLEKKGKSDTDRPTATFFIAGVGSEKVKFEPAIKCVGKAENYLQTLLQAQITTLSRCLSNSFKRYPTQNRVDWLMAKDPKEEPLDPAQIVLLVSQMDFVIGTEKALVNYGKGDTQAVINHFDFCKNQLSALIQLTQTQLTRGDRQRVMCMITLDAHSRDIVDVLLRENAFKCTDFQWQSKLRPKFIGEGKKNSAIMLSSGAEFRICDASFEYGFEYLGNGPRLVVTPLTDRIYVTATQALNLKMGCAPAGPAGTGKTETTKDLASSLGKCCYVFNCSPEMDYQSMGNIFKGLAASGSWGCFDEFNRLIPEVLSVCSVQFKAVCDQLRAFVETDMKTHEVTIEGDTVGLDPTCGVFITMNPGYLGRSELPEGLKALFRPITVIVPDLVLICENMLMAEGFLTAKTLASKFYGLYTLLAELLSKQPHYDWGLRAVKSVLVVAGQLKRHDPDLAEDVLLMRALRDFNIPKIVQVDEVVFFGLLNDLFPGLNPPRVFDEELSECVSTACEQHGLWPDPFFTLKVMQLDELLDIRHCVFIMGPPGAGKSTSWKMLQAARNIRTPDMKVKTVDLNPKVMQTEDLYGHISIQTREWKDGLLSSVMRDLGRIPDEKPKWIILDGDLDANWIESMNSVMDDNKMLTLASNERIPLKAHMKMIFEIRDLKYATPATVSRAGILYISTDTGSQWRSIIGSWVRGRPDELLEDLDREKIHTMFEKYLPESLKFFATSLSGIVQCNDISLTITVLRLLDCILTRSVVMDDSAFETSFVFCLIWGFGSSLTISDDGTDHRKVFSDWFRSKFKTVKIPSRDTIFDYWLDPRSSKFESWKSSPAFRTVEFDSNEMNMAEITVPTAETASVSNWLDLLVNAGYHAMLAGPAGTGKTQLVNGLLSQLKPDFHVSASVNMNFYTSASVLLTSMEVPLQKRTGSTFGPPGSAKLVYFIDDLNLPELDPYGTQSAIALIRQHIDYGHWYDLAKLSIKNVDDCQYISALNPTAGSFAVDARLQRHFTTFAVGMPSATSLLTIYQTFLDGHLTSMAFNKGVCDISSSMIKGALAVHKEVSDTFRKTAANFHYSFNIRHLANVFQGLLVATPLIFNDPEKFVYLWLHESERVYGDRLVDYEDLAKFKMIMQSQAKKTFAQFNVQRFYISGGGIKADPLVFCHFADAHSPTAGDGDELNYEQALDVNDLRTTLDASLNEYNEVNAAMNLVLFDDAVLHVARIVRIVKQTGGHALLVGVGGSGKQSLSKLSAYICGYSCIQLMVGPHYGMIDFKADLQNMYTKAGIKLEGVLFLLTDTQIVNEKFFIYLNDLLSSGNIPDLYSRDEKEAIINTVTGKAKAAGYSADPVDVWKYFIGKIRENLHVCLCFSPVGAAMRTRARRFPAIASCTVIDWFQPWPEQALASVGKNMLVDVDVGGPDIMLAIENFMPTAFVAVNKACRQFAITEGKYVYTTPKSYLEMISLFLSMLSSKRIAIDASINRLASGVEKLMQAAEDVVELEANLQIMLASAEERRQMAEGIAQTVKDEKEIVEIENEKAVVEAAKVAELQSEVAKQQASASKDLELAEPAVMKAMAALDSLDKRDLGNCKTMTKPPPGVDDIFAAVMVLLAGLNPNIITQKTGKVREKERTWDYAKKCLLGNVNGFLDELKGYKACIDEGGVPEINFKEIRQFLVLEHFDPDIIQTRNSAAAGLCSWVINIVKYYDIVLLVEPKRIALRAANETLDVANAQLSAVKARVAELQARLDKLTEEYNAAEAQRLEAQNIAEKGAMKLELANRLTKALGNEKLRWNDGITLMSIERGLLVGNCLMASAFISYIGPFTKAYRDNLMSNVLAPLVTNPPVGVKIPMSEEGHVLSLLCTEAEIAEYQTQGLPADRVSAENGAIVLNSIRYPLLVDPQLQAVKWIKKRHGDALIVGRLGQKHLITKVMRAISDGGTFLIENMNEHIDPALMPVIGRVTIKRAGRRFIQLGDDEVEVNPNFRLFLHTKLNNPHYPPEVQAETTLVNFSVTQKGLEEQLLSLVVRHERPDLAAQRAALILQQNLFTIRVKQLGDNILLRLADAQGDITDDRDLIEELELSKKISEDISVKLRESKVTSEKLDVTSEKYRPVARRGALLFFVIHNLHKVHTYYLFSLNSFVSFFLRGISLAGRGNLVGGDTDEAAVAAAKALIFSADEAKQESNLEVLERQIAQRVEEIEERDQEEAGSDLPERLKQLKQAVSLVVFNFVRQGLFEKDKLTVATLFTFRIMVDEGLLDKGFVDTMIRGRIADDVGNRGLDLSVWLSEAAWARLKSLEEDLSSTNPLFENLGEKIAADADEWEEWYNHPAAELHAMPGDYRGLDEFGKLVLLRVLRPDRLPFALSSYIKDKLGEDFVFQLPFTMKETYKYTNSRAPVLFVLYPGVDPTPWVEELGKSYGMTAENGTFANISMGQGQEAPADHRLLEFAETGGWIFLQNVHLMQSWLPSLEEKLETLTPHENFRVFISAEPPPLPYLKNIPEGLQQSCICVANEPPSDLKANLSRAWANFSEERVTQSTKPNILKACLFGLCFFHSLMLGRRRFGSQGWSRAYGFNVGDLRICADVLESYLNRSISAGTGVPWADLRYLFGEIMYGGHITDFFDRRTNNTYLQVIMDENLLHKGDLAPQLQSPDASLWNYNDYTNFITKLLPPESPSIYGLHPNAEIGFFTNKAENLCTTILQLELGSSAETSGNSSQNYAKEVLVELLGRVPASFDIITLSDRCQQRMLDSDGPYVVVVLQECTRLNALVAEMLFSLDELQKGMNGQLNMSQAMEDMTECLSLNMVPGRNPFHACNWERLAWASKKSLSSWFSDLLLRREQLEGWSKSLKLPYSLWLPGLINPTALLTAVKQVTARKRGLPLDNMSLDTHVTRLRKVADALSLATYPEDGAYVHGLLMEGARWTDEEESADSLYTESGVGCAGNLTESKLKVLLEVLPIIYVKAVAVQPSWSPECVGYLRSDPNLYECPVYLTSARGATFVFLSTLKSVDPVHRWVLAGVALLMQSDE